MNEWHFMNLIDKKQTDPGNNAMQDPRCSVYT